MTRFLVFVLLTAITALGTELSKPSCRSKPQITFNKDVLPVLKKTVRFAIARRCRSNVISDIRKHPAMGEGDQSGGHQQKMPPWFADPHVGEFRNAPKLTPADVNTLTAWADRGASEGNPATKPPAVKWAEGWRIQPDVIVSMPQPYRVAAKGAGEVKEFFIPSPFKEDTWVSAIEIRPGDPSVVHHVIVQIPENAMATDRTVAIRGTDRWQRASRSAATARRESAGASASKGASSKQGCAASSRGAVAEATTQLATNAQAAALAVTANRVRSMAEARRAAHIQTSLSDFARRRPVAGHSQQWKPSMLRERNRWIFGTATPQN